MFDDSMAEAWLYHPGNFPVVFPRLARVDDRIDAAFDVTWIPILLVQLLFP